MGGSLEGLMFELTPEKRVGVHQVAKGVGILGPGSSSVKAWSGGMIQHGLLWEVQAGMRGSAGGRGC